VQTSGIRLAIKGLTLITLEWRKALYKGSEILHKGSEVLREPIGVAHELLDVYGLIL
jgi:hypothetical protein